MASTNENLVPNLPKLTSLSITFNKEIPVSADHIFNKFFECIVSNGKLQYFHTSTALSNYLVNKMLLNCRDLKVLAWNPTRYNAKVIHSALDIIHGQSLPRNDRDEGILKIKVRKRQGKNASHPWLKYLDSVPSSPVLDSARFSGLSYKASLVD